MLPYLNYCKPPNKNIAGYAAALYARAHESEYISRKNVHLDDWQPAQNKCHANALILETFGDGYTALHGWLFLDFDGTRDFVRFIAHSVVMTAERQLLDVTPYYPDAPSYPFLASHLSDMDYEAMLDTLINQYGSAYLDYRI